VVAHFLHRLLAGLVDLVAALDTAPGFALANQTQNAGANPPRMRSLCLFLLRFALLFGLLTLPWPGRRQIVNTSFRAETRCLLAAALPRETFHILTFSAFRYPSLDVLVIVAKPNQAGPAGPKQAVQVPFDTDSQGWIPMAMVMALFVATPVPWSKRWKGLGVGLLAMQLMVMATILVSILFSMSSEATPSWERLFLLLANHLLVENIWFDFVAPFLFWAAWLACAGHWQELGVQTGARSRTEADSSPPVRG